MTSSGCLTEQWKGFLFIAAADLMWGLSGTVSKYLFNNQVSPMDLTQLRLVISVVILVLYLGLFKRALLKIAREDRVYFLIFGIFGVAVVQFTYLNTISLTNVATGVFLQYLAPAFVLLYGLIFKGEKLSLTNFFALIFALAGGFLIAKGKMGGGFSVSSIGLLSGLASGISFAFYTVYGKKGLAKYSSWTMLLWGFGVGALVWCLYQPPWVTLAKYSWQEWLFFGYIALFATVLPFGFFFKGLNYMAPVKAGIVSTLEPVMAGVVAYLILGELLSFMQITGCILVLMAVVIIQLAGLRPVAQNNQQTSSSSQP